jgi:hypothetical protein
MEIDIRNYGAKCDGITDDKDAIDKVIKAIPGSGATILFPPGSICLTRGLHELPNNTIIKAYGAKIIKKPDPSIKSGELNHLFMAIDGNKNLRVCGGIYDLHRSAYNDGDLVSAFFLCRHTGAEFCNVTMQNGSENALKFWNTGKVIIKNSRFINFFNNIIEFGNPIKDGGDKKNAAIPVAKKYIIKNNYFHDVDDHKNGAGNACGIGIGADINSNQSLTDINISNNTFIGCNRAIWLETRGHREIHSVDISYNTIIGSITSSQTLHGIGFIGVQDSSIKNNVLINVANTYPPALITGNQIYASITIPN